MLRAHGAGMKTLLAMVWLTSTFGLTAPASSPQVVAPATPVGDYRWPLSPEPSVVRRFEAPPQRWAAGHRGVDLLASPSVGVLAAGDGLISHSAVIAGRGTVSIIHPDGRRTTYEPLDARIAAGTRVSAGDLVGTLSSDGSHCAPRACLHWGLLVGKREYRDPLTLLRPSRVRLLSVP